MAPNLDEVRTLANRVQQPVAAVSAVSAPTDGTLQQILGLLQKMATSPQQQQQQQMPPTREQCQGCGGRSCKSRSSCPAKGKTCNHCKKLNHFQHVCRQALREREQHKQQ